MAGAIWQQNGFLREIGDKFPAINYITDYFSDRYYYNQQRYPVLNGGLNNNYNSNPYYNNNPYNSNPYNGYNNQYQSGGSGYGYPQQNQQYGNNYDSNRDQDNNDGRPRVILPGEMGGQPKSLDQAGNYYPGGQQMYGGGQGGYDPRMMGPQGQQQPGFDPRMFGPGGYDPRCPYRWTNFTNQYVQGSCALCAGSK